MCAELYAGSCSEQVNRGGGLSCPAGEPPHGLRAAVKAWHEASLHRTEPSQVQTVGARLQCGKDALVGTQVAQGVGDRPGRDYGTGDRGAASADTRGLVTGSDEARRWERKLPGDGLVLVRS